MRQIKFRGKRIDNGEWAYGYYFCNGEDHGIVTNIGFPGNWFPVDPATVGQFTGLTDKNGKEVFEGDLITGHTSFELPNDEAEWTKENPATVDYDIRSGSFYPFSYNNRWRCDLENIEIIGNIHEKK